MTDPNLVPPPPPGRPRRGGCLLGGMLALALIAALAFIVVLAVLVIGEGAAVEEGSILVVGTEADYPETTSFRPFPLADPGQSFGELVAGVERAAEDPRIAGLHLRIGETSLGWAGARELRSLAGRFRERGKPVTAALETASLRDYYLATAADRIHLHPRGQLALFGISLEAIFYADLLETAGIEAQFEAIGPWKTAPEAYTRSGMSGAHREQLESLAEGFRGGVAAGVAEGRGMPAEAAAALLADGPYTAGRALELGLVDALSYRDQLESDLEERPRIGLGDYLRAAGPGFLSAAPVVGVVSVEGAILPGENREDLVLGKIAGASAIADALSRLEEDGSVVAVVLRVSSPGGADTAADTIWRAARQLGMRKPLIASFGDTAASGGYWIATAADRVVAEPLSITGSIGVWAGKFSIGGLLGKIGLAMEAVSADGNPNWLSPARPLEADDLARLRETIGETYRVFLERVAAARGLTPEEVDAVGQGRVFTGRQALGAGLVDELGGLRRAIRLAASAAGVPEDAPVETIFLPEPPTLLEALEARLDTAPGLRERTSLLAAMAGGTRMVLLPFQPRIR